MSKGNVCAVFRMESLGGCVFALEICAGSACRLVQFAALLSLPVKIDLR